MGNFDKPGLEFIFCADDFAYYKSPRCRRLDVEFGDVKFQIVDRESAIMIRFQRVVLEHAFSLVNAVIACAQLDWYDDKHKVLQLKNFVPVRFMFQNFFQSDFFGDGFSRIFLGKTNDR